jgi:transposase-like protein
MNLPDLIEQFRSEDKCREYLEDLRWPDGVRCPRCGNDSTSKIEKRHQFECNESSCRYQFSVTAGTVFHDSHLPLWKWFLAIYLIGESKKGISAKQLQRTLGTSYKTAWYLGHRVRSAMEDGSPVPLSGIVEADETWIGGVHHKTPKDPSGRAKKKLVLGAISRDGELRLVMRPGNGRETKASYRQFIKDVVGDDAEYIFTDSDASWGEMTSWKPDGTKHRKVDHSADEWVRGIVHTNTIESVWSLFKRSVVGTYHQLSAKHLPAYLDEMAFRFNNRHNAYLFRDTLLRMVEGETLPYAELVEAKDD